MKVIWARLGSPDAISAVSMVAIGVQVYFGSLVAPFVDISGRVIEFLLLRGGAVMAMLAVLGLGRMLLNQFTRHKPQPLLTLSVFVAAGLTLPLATNFLLIQSGFTNDWVLPQRLAISLPGSFAMMVAGALIVGSARDLTRTNRRLSASVATLSRTKTKTAEIIAERKADLLSAVKQEVTAALNSIKSASTTQTIRGLENLIDGVVRPLSYRLAREIPKNPDEERLEGDARISWRNLLGRTLSVIPGSPAITVAWQGSLLAMFLVPAFGLAGAVGSTVVMASSAIGLSAVKFFWQHLPEKLHSLWKALLFFVSVTAFTVAPLPVATYLTGYDLLVAHALIGWLILSQFIAWTIALASAIAKDLKSTNMNLISVVERLQRETISLNNELRMVQQGVARALHGPVQQVITATLIKFHSLGDSEDLPAAVEDFRQRLTAELAALENPKGSQTDFRGALEEVKEIWDEVADIQIDIDDGATAIILRNPASQLALTDLIREACGNAIRHGDATNIHIQVVATENIPAISLTVRNNGRKLPRELIPGLGAEMFDEMSYKWTLKQRGKSVELHAFVPIRNG